MTDKTLVERLREKLKGLYTRETNFAYIWGFHDAKQAAIEALDQEQAAAALSAQGGVSRDAVLEEAAIILRDLSEHYARQEDLILTPGATMARALQKVLWEGVNAIRALKDKAPPSEEELDNEALIETGIAAITNWDMPPSRETVVDIVEAVLAAMKKARG